MSGPRLVNRSFFAMADSGAPDGIKCDTEGNVYAGWWVFLAARTERNTG